MNVVSWNMGCASSKYKCTHDDAWQYLVEDLRPDVALIQEVLLHPPLFFSGRGRFFAHGAWEGQFDWGSGVYVLALAAQEVQTISRRGVHATAAQIKTGAGPVVVVSLHVGDYDVACFSDIANLLAPMLADQRLIVAGDFNAARRFDEVYHKNSNHKFFDKMRAVGFFECHWRLHGYEIPSFWGNQATEGYQDDHFFVNESLGSRVKVCEVIDNPTVRRLSDHAPVRLVIDL